MAMEYIYYKANPTIIGKSTSTRSYVCDFTERDTVLASLLGSVDEDDAFLMCFEAPWDHLGNDPACGKIRIDAQYGPLADVVAKTPDLPFKFKVSFKSETFTISGEGWVWDTGDLPILNKNVLPNETVYTGELVLFGCRSSVDFSTFTPWQGKINSDVFLGAPPGYLLFLGADIQPRMIGAVEVLDVEVHIMYKAPGFNYFWNEDQTGWDKIVKLNVFSAESGFLYEEVAFASLLT